MTERARARVAAWKRANPDAVRRHNREHMRRKRKQLILARSQVRS